MKALRLILPLIFLFLYSCSVGAQLHTDSKKAEKFFNKAYESYKLRDHSEALINLDKSLQADPEFIEALMMRAQIYKDLGEVSKAIVSFEKAMTINPEFMPSGFIVLASYQLNQGYYSEAHDNISRFLDLEDFSQISRGEAEVYLKKAEFAMKEISHPVPFNPVNLGDSINSEYREYWPSLSVNEKMLVFTVLLPANTNDSPSLDKMQEDFYYSEKNNSGVWGKRKSMGDRLNTNNNEGAQTVSSDGNELYFTACNRQDGLGMCDIYFSSRANKSWTIPVNMGSPVNSKYSEKQPSISSDKKVLYFASNRPGGLGGLDIWYSQRDKNGNWGKPVNMGEIINTEGDDQSPFIHPDNQTLYFSSEGHENLGKGDIFYSRMTPGGEWTPPKNIGYPINTHNNEIGLIVNSAGNKAYFASDREEGKSLDIYTFDLYEDAQPVEVSYMTGRVYDARNYKGIQADFQLLNLATSEIIMEVTSNPGEGDYLIPLPTNHDYALIVSHPGYLFYSENFTFSGKHSKKDPFIKNIPLKPVKSGEKIVLKNIFFEYDSYTLLDESKVELNVVSDFIKKNQDINVEISGHTDNTGSAAYNRVLSEQRAKSVVDYLVNTGIAPSRLEYKGYGDTMPVESNDTEEGRAANRRTEFKIMAPR